VWWVARAGALTVGHDVCVELNGCVVTRRAICLADRSAAVTAAVAAPRTGAAAAVRRDAAGLDCAADDDPTGAARAAYAGYTLSAWLVSYGTNYTFFHSL